MSAIANNNHRPWPLLALKSAPASPSRLHWDNLNGEPPLAKLEWKELEYWMRRKRITIGRNSSKGEVDIDMGHSSFVSRVHLEIKYENSIFYLRCNGKNGIFVDGVFQRRGASPLQLPKQCVLRFPSTSLCVVFTSMLASAGVESLQLLSRSPAAEGASDPPGEPASLGEPGVTPAPADQEEDIISRPLVISIPGAAAAGSRLETTVNGQNGAETARSTHKFQYSDSPLPSPTGTISAANSCPASPGSVQQLPLRRQQLFSRHVKAGHQKLGRAAGALQLVTPVADSRAEEITLHYERDDGHGSCSQRVLLLNSNDTPAPCLPPSGGPAARTGPGKPPFSYAQLIIQAITSASERQLTLSGIYAFITRHYPYYRTADKGWQNSIRHNLSLNRYFVKVARGHEQPGKGSFWRLETTSEGRLAEQAYRRRRQRAGASLASSGATSGAAAGAVLDDIGEGDGDTPVSYSSQSAPVSPSQSRYSAFDQYDLDAGAGDSTARAPRVLLTPGPGASPTGPGTARPTCMSAPGSPRHHPSTPLGYSLATANNGDAAVSGSHLMSALQGKSPRSLSSLSASEGAAILAMESLQSSVVKPPAHFHDSGSAAELLLAAAAVAHKRQLADERQEELVADCGEKSDCKRVCLYGTSD